MGVLIYLLAPLIDVTSTLNLLNHADYERIHKCPPRVAPKTLLTDSQRVVGRHTSLPPGPLVERAGVEPASSARAKGSKPLCSFTPPPQRNFALDVVQVGDRLEAHPCAGRRRDGKPSPIRR